MLDPTSLFRFADHVDQRRVRAGVLVVTLGSFHDAGHVQRLINRHLLDTLPNHVLGTFDSDQVHDYTGRRPPIVFDRDHFRDFEGPDLTLHHVTTPDGTPFLLLTGPEPSLQWERMAASVAHLADQFDVERTVLVSSMPAPTPHTRPVVVSRFGAQPGDVGEAESHLGTFQLSSSFSSLLTLRFGEQGRRVVGVLAHVPHYLGDTDVPGAAIAALDAVGDASGLRLPTEALAQPARDALAAVDAQVVGSEELTELVGALEQQYDAYMAGRRRLTAEAEQIPSADEIGAQVEDFLRALGDEPQEGPGADPA